MTKEERIEKAVSLFKEGYNCSQSVVGAYADLYGFTFEQAIHISASFGGGIGRKLVERLAACFCWQGWSDVPRTGPTAKGKRPTTSWCRNWPESLRKNVERFVVPICWDFPRQNPLFPLQKPVLRSIMPSARVLTWWKQQREFGAISWKMKENCNKNVFSWL